MDLISVIVPVYNVEKYLRKCIDSILSQTYTNLEIILVDDGSVDNSDKICDEYKEKDSRIVVIHKENGGASSARNVGLDMAHGEYIGFIDSDDYIDSDMYEELYKNMQDNNADLSICGILNLYQGIEPKRNIPDKKVMLAAGAIKLMLTGLTVSPCNKLFKRKLFKDIRYPTGKTAEDAFILIEILLKCDIVAFTSEEKYYYVHRGNSITTRKYHKSDDDVIEAWEKNYKLISENCPELASYAISRVCWAYLYVLDKVVYADMEKECYRTNEIIKFIKNHIRDILNAEIFSIKKKVMVLFLYVSLHLYKRCIKYSLNVKRKVFKQR
jgi:glycosyltransferase involved in cell wall biosynthesis